MQTRRETILAILTEGLGEGQEELAAAIESLIDEHPAYKMDAAEREVLRKAVELLLRPRTHNLRLLMNCPDRIINSVAPAAPAAATPQPEELLVTRPPTQGRLDMLEL